MSSALILDFQEYGWVSYNPCGAVLFTCAKIATAYHQILCFTEDSFSDYRPGEVFPRSKLAHYHRSMHVFRFRDVISLYLGRLRDTRLTRSVVERHKCPSQTHAGQETLPHWLGTFTIIGIMNQQREHAACQSCLNCISFPDFICHHQSTWLLISFAFDIVDEGKPPCMF